MDTQTKGKIEIPSAGQSVFPLPAIDVHGHFGRNCRDGRDKQSLYGSAEPFEVVERIRACNIETIVVSPFEALFPRGCSDVLSGNRSAADAVANHPELWQWVVVNPLDSRTFDQAVELLKNPKAVGIKVHPEEHLYDVKDHGEAIFAFAARYNLLVSAHSGEVRSMPEDFLPFADAYPNVTLILAHLGCSCDGDRMHQVRAVERSKHGNVYTDTSSAMNVLADLLESAVRRIGADKILFGTDTPLYFTPMQRARIEFAAISELDKRKILRENALTLFEKVMPRHK